MKIKIMTQKISLIGTTALLSLVILALANCSASGGSSGSSGCSSKTACCTYPTNMDTSVTSLPAANAVSSNNTMIVNVGCGYINEPCVSVTICEVGSTTKCRTINNILLDTGSYGLRLFNCGIDALNLPTETVNSREVAECVSYADGTQDWGPVKKADIYLAGQLASNANFQYVDANYATAPTSCSNRENNPSLVGFNGILGVGLFTHDCGANCVTSASYGLYYTCSGTSCTSSTMSLANQVSNPVSLLGASYNNGVSLDFSSFNSSSAVTTAGQMTIGISSLSSVSVYSASSQGSFNTLFNSTVYGVSSSNNSQAFIDSGSNGLFFPPPGGLTACSTSGSASGFYCPPSSQNFTAYVSGSTTTPTTSSRAVPFQIDNANTMLDSSNPNYVFTNLGGSFSGAFDWGLPFFLSRRVYVQMQGTTIGGSVGPAWGF